jgi:citrate synthase
MNAGLDGVVVAQTILSEVDGNRGRLVIRGAPIEELAGNITFEAAAARLWEGLSNHSETLERVSVGLGEARKLAFERLKSLISTASQLSFIEGLRLGLSALSDKEEIPHHYLVTGAIPSFLAALVRAKKGFDAIAPDESLGQAADFLRTMRGARASSDEESALDAYLVTIMEHGMNASTFTARVIASTKAGTISSVVGALCALKGPLHGGAPGPVLDMLDEIGTEEQISSWLSEHLSAGERLMGFGHRIYKVRDPRADVLKEVVAKLRSSGNRRLAFAEKVEEAALKALAAHKPDRPLHTNVEFYTALVLDAVGLDRELFTPIFAMGRVIGWTAHVFEQERTGRLMRPQSEYVGP